MAERTPIFRLWLFSFLADFLAVVSAYYTTYYLRFDSDLGQSLYAGLNRFLGVRDDAFVGPFHELFYIISAPRIILLLTLTVCFIYAFYDLYAGRRLIVKRPLLRSVVMANAIALLAFMAYFYLSRNVFHPRSLFTTVIFFNVIYCIIYRSVTELALDWLRCRFGVDTVRAVVVGSGKEADTLRKYIELYKPQGFTVVKRIDVTEGRPIRQALKDAAASVEGEGLHCMMLADSRITTAEIMEGLEACDRLGIPVKVLSGEVAVIRNQGGISGDVFLGTPLVHFGALRLENAWTHVNQLFVRVLALLALIVLSPFFALIALLVRISSAGSVFFMQERIGINRQPFRMYKFRTMYEKSDEVQAQLEEFNDAGAGLFKMRKDPRVTTAGRFIRRFSLDEFPQLINVVRGEMGLIGPRPLPRRDFENYYEEWHYSRHSGLPGLTCLWQVSGRSDLDFHNMCILDVFYLHNRNWIMNLKILLRTAGVVLFGRGAY